MASLLLRLTHHRWLATAILLAVVVLSSIGTALLHPGHTVVYARARTATLPASGTTSVTDPLPDPFWWSGTCDTTNYSSSPSNPAHLAAHPLLLKNGTPASYRGVLACGPRPIADKGPDVLVTFPGGHMEYEWECVELVMRYMYLAYGINAYPGNGNQVVSNYITYNTNPILQPVSNNGSSQTSPQPGDILSYNSGAANGHTSLVIKNNVNSTGNGTLTVLEQNFSATGEATLPVGSNASLPAWEIGKGVTGWLHHIVDLFPQSAPTNAKVSVVGTGFAANEPVVITFGGATQLGTTTANAMGAVSTTITVPASAQPGAHAIQLTGQTSGFAPQTVLYAQANWAMFGYNAQHTHYNPYEALLTSANASMLTLDWSYTTGGEIIWSSPAVADGVVYIGSQDRYLYALDAATGAFKWRYFTNDANGAFQSSPAVVNGVVYVGSIDGNLYALDAETGILKWKFTTSGAFESSPAVVNGVVYVGSEDNNLYALNATTGAFKWKFPTLSPVDFAPAVANGIVYINVYNDATLYAVDAATGTLKWSYHPASNSVLPSSPAIANGVVYFGSADGNLYALDAITGAFKWSFDTGSAISSSPAITKGVVYIGSESTAIYALKATTGALLWDYSTAAGIASSPAVVNGIVYVGSDDDNLYAFHLP